MEWDSSWLPLYLNSTTTKAGSFTGPALSFAGDIFDFSWWILIFLWYIHSWLIPKTSRAARKGRATRINNNKPRKRRGWISGCSIPLITESFTVICGGMWLPSIGGFKGSKRRSTIEWSRNGLRRGVQADISGKEWERLAASMLLTVAATRKWSGDSNNNERRSRKGAPFCFC